MIWFRTILVAAIVTYVLRALLASASAPLAWTLSLAAGASILLAHHLRHHPPSHTTPLPSAAADPDKRHSLQIALGPHYAVQHRLGAGAFGVVYAVRDLPLERDLAVKVLVPTDQDAIRRFQREAVILANLRHPNIVPVYFVGSGGGLLFAVMPHIKGPNLRWLLTRHSPLGLNIISSVVADVAAALDEAHRARVIHRDVKPENVLLDTEHRTALLGDFGIAKFSLVPPPPTLTGDTEELLVGGFVIGTIIGTPEYMSPEQCSGGEISYATDVYSLACVTYEMLIGSPPFCGAPADIFRMHLTSPPSPLRPVRGEIPPELESCVLQGLAKAPHDRFPTAGEFASAVAKSAGVTPITGAWSRLTILAR